MFVASSPPPNVPRSLLQASADVSLCLHHQLKKKNLTPDCEHVLTEKQKLLAIDMDFNYPLKLACAVEMDTICKKY